MFDIPGIILLAAPVLWLSVMVSDWFRRKRAWRAQRWHCPQCRELFRDERAWYRHVTRCRQG
jgi:hypothetical protein